MKAKAMKKLLFVPLVLISTISAFADSFTDAIQDLAIQTACLGMYSMTEAGGGWHDDPHDYYTPQMMAERFAEMSGNMTRTATFYGVCFDYAQCAWEDIENYKGWYNKQGMYEGQFWLAWDYNNDPNTIELGSPAKSSSAATKIMNGVPIKTYSSSLRSVKTHRQNNGKGPRATGHAWLWIERADGVWFWIDPTWTDNTGYVVYGYVSNDEEIQCRPDRDFCINYPDALNRLPLPPPMGAKKAPSRSANSTDRNETIKDAGSDWMTELFLDESRDFEDGYVVFFAAVNVPFPSIMDKSPNVNQMSFSLEMPVLVNIAAILGLEYLQNITDDYRIHGGLFTFDFTRRLTNNIAWYLGGGMGFRFDPDNDSESFVPHNTPVYLADTRLYAFKVDTGFLLNISRIFTKIEVSYDNIIGFSVGTGIGFGSKLY